MVNIYQQEFSKLTRVNSCIIGERIIVILKKDSEGKACSVYVAYDYKTKKQLLFDFDKEILINKLKSLEGRFNEIED